MMSSVEKEKKAAAAAVGGKTARACDGCIRRRARWYCAADDAFLCQQCDASVHSANPLARRHERLRLRMAAPAPPALSVAKPEELVPAWFKRKARTPRAHHLAKFMRRMAVPEMVESDETNEEEEEEEEEEGQLLYRVPVFDPVLAEFCSPPASLQDSNCSNGSSEAEESKPQVLSLSQFTSGSTTTVTTSSDSGGGGDLAGFGPSEEELTEFAADMETLLGHGLDDVGAHDDSLYMHTLGLMDSAGVGAGEAGEMLEMDFECGSPMTAEEGQEQKLAVAASYPEQRFILNLDYEAIIAKWGSSPWTDGERPQLRLDSFWPDCMGIWMGGGRQGEEVGIARMAMDEGREARVTRYREKRRTRLFSKKIRYEVRKLNAEKRPRMKGRFVKRAPFAAAANTGAAACLS